MARFMVKASEYKNVCKSVNDRKLAELKKEIIEILKKQDEKEFKKAVDLFESQEMHYTHLEKSITGKWVEKAGYGVGTVRIWKGKKYKKIAPGKWARVFDKEGRGTNIAIGKLIAKVQKIDNVEDLMALVMANKQRFVDENGVDLPVLDKLRAAVDARNGNVGSKETSKPAEKKEANIETFTADDFRNASREKLYDMIGLKYHQNVKYKNEIWTVDAIAATGHEDGKFQLALLQHYPNGEIKNRKYITALDIDKVSSIEEQEKPDEKKEEDSKAYEGKLATQKQVDEATAISNKYEVPHNEMLKMPITTIQKYANSTVEDFEGGIDKFIEYMAEGRSEGVSMDEVGKEFAKLINHNVARKIWDDYESGALVPDEKGNLKPKEEFENKESDYVQKKRDAKEGYWSDEFKERNMNNIKQKIEAMKEDGASDKKIKAYLEETIETNTNDIPWRKRAIEEGRIKGNQANDYRDTIQERTVRIENCKELLKEYETKVEKSLEETFLMDMAVEEEIQKVEEEQEEESLFDDYSAEQPGLFNSTAMKVQEAFNRCNIL